MAEDPDEAPASAPKTDAAAAARADRVAAIIRNGLSNGPIAQSPATWDHLNTRLGEIVAALMQEI